jgi:hypothetical protein
MDAVVGDLERKTLAPLVLVQNFFISNEHVEIFEVWVLL